MKMRTCVTQRGKFRYAVHKPSYRVNNLRQKDYLLPLGDLPNGSQVLNKINFPQGDLEVNQASVVYEIPNAFPFRGSTFIDSAWADSRAGDHNSIRVSPFPEISITRTLSSWSQKQGISFAAAERLFEDLPAPLLLAVATTSTDPEDLIRLARLACEFSFDGDEDTPVGLKYKLTERNRPLPVIHDHDLFEAVGNNPSLPDQYKEVMLLRPGAQGSSEVVGDYTDEAGNTLVFEYLRSNSYIPWGHYASNMGHEAVRYRIRDLSLRDMRGLRHLYYQRTFVRMAQDLGLDGSFTCMSLEKLESLRQQVLAEVHGKDRSVRFSGSLWGWNFGFDFTPTRYRMHGSHQQVHQQHSMIPCKIRVVENCRNTEDELQAFGAGDMVAEAVHQYYQETGRDFFDDYIRCLRSNRRIDGRKGQESLIVYEDEHVLLFVPKAQVSQWEMQLMPLACVGNILEADTHFSAALDRGILLALRILEDLGAKMVTSIEYSKRFTDTGSSQRLVYSFLPKLPWSPGSFSEAQHRFICGHYPEDFAAACRSRVDSVLNSLE
jgi:hypothetical protein